MTTGIVGEKGGKEERKQVLMTVFSSRQEAQQD
jgi:hypothetical protein